MKQQMAQHLTERTDSLEQGHIYTADSDSDAYGSLLAAMDLGAEFLGEHYYEDGVRSIAVRVPVEGGARKNSVARLGARVRIGEKFYGKALLDYRPDWRPMWWREAIQNSVDAGRKKNGSGITRIDLTVESLPDGSRLVSCVDNGGGMSWDTFENKFLMLGESGKEATPRYDYKTEMERTRASTEETEEGDAGGFGEAKRLLILPWLDVEVHSQDWVTKATPSAEETFFRKKAPHYLDGVRLTVRMPADKFCDVEHALRVVTRSFLPNVRFTVNGAPYRADLPLGEEIEPFADACSGKALLYHSPRSRKFRVGLDDESQTADSIDGHKPKKTGEMIVRKRGIWMFSLPVESKVPGYLVLRLVAPSVDMLTASRMQIGDSELYSAVHDQLRELAKDHHKALKKKNNYVWKPYKGSLGMVRAEVREEHERLGAIMKQQVGAADKIAEREGVTAVQELIERTNKVADEAEKKAEDDGETRDKPVGAVEGPQGGDDSYGGEEDEDDGESAESGPPRLQRDPSLAKVLAEAASRAGSDGMEALVQVIQGMPDTTILSEIDDFYRDKESGKILTGRQYRREHGIDEEDDIPQRLLWRPAKRFDPAHMTPQLRKLLKYWTECLSVILIALGEKRPFGVGWVFDFRRNSAGDAEGALAAHAQRDGKHWLLLNPFRGGDIKAEKLYSLRNDQDLKLIHSCAMHEATHFHNYVSDHDVDFAIALTKNIAIANLSLSDLRTVRDAAVKRPAGWKPKPKAAPKVKPPKLKDDVEKIVADAGKEFRKTSFSSAYLPKLDQGKSWWDLLTDFEGGSQRAHRIRHGGTDLYRSPPFDGYDKAAAAAQTAVTLDQLRRLISEAYGSAALAPAVDEDLESSLKEWVETAEKKLHDSGGFGGEFYGTSGGGKTVEVEFARATDEKQNPKNSYDVIVRVDDRYVGTKETPSVPRKDDWQKVAARAIIKAAAPMLAERWRQ